jgi:hypothetical protein
MWEGAPGGLGAILAPDKPWADKWPLAALEPRELPKPTPVVLAVPWYSAFDRPVLTDGRWRITSNVGALGYVRGWHAICVQPAAMSDLVSWWEFYDQLRTGECVGFAFSRMMTLLNRARYDAPWLYFATQDAAGQPRDPLAGTYPAFAADVLRTVGHKTPRGDAPKLANGIAANRWAVTVDEIRACLQSPAHDRREAFPLLNSWGRPGYPHVVDFPYVTMEAMYRQDAEATAVTDR